VRRGENPKILGSFVPCRQVVQRSDIPGLSGTSSNPFEDLTGARQMLGCSGVVVLGGHRLPHTGLAGKHQASKSFKRIQCSWSALRADKAKPLPLVPTRTRTSHSRVLSFRKLAVIIVRQRSNRSDDERRTLTSLCKGDTGIREATELAERFVTIVRDRCSRGLTGSASVKAGSMAKR
jgi:hypothetical protein